MNQLDVKRLVCKCYIFGVFLLFWTNIARRWRNVYSDRAHCHRAYDEKGEITAKHCSSVPKLVYSININIALVGKKPLLVRRTYHIPYCL